MIKTGIWLDLKAAFSNRVIGGPKGDLIYSSPLVHSFKHTGFHGTQLENVVDQFSKGYFKNKNLDVYFIPHYEINAIGKAAFWAGNNPNSIILEIGSNQTTITNHIFHTRLFPKGNEQKIIIINAWLVSSEWKERVWEHRSKQVSEK